MSAEVESKLASLRTNKEQGIYLRLVVKILDYQAFIRLSLVEPAVNYQLLFFLIQNHLMKLSKHKLSLFLRSSGKSS